VRLTPRTARLLILRKATQYRSERAMTVMGVLAPKQFAANERGAQWCAIAMTHMNRKPFRMRRLAQAVCVVRRNQLVPNSVLVAAGFNPGRP
jgi:hypothetical protein